MVRRKKKDAIREQARALRKEMIVRYRGDGHIRLQLPGGLCTPTAAALFAEELHGIEGVYRVLTYQRAGKLSIRYMAEVCTLSQIVDGLDAAVERVLTEEPEQTQPGEKKGLLGSITAPFQRAKARYQDARAKAKVVYDLVASKNKLMAKLPFDPEGWAIAFANDLVVFYLVKVHWDRITKQWLPSPFKHRYEWLTVIYMTFLLVRYRRRQNAAKALPKPKA